MKIGLLIHDINNLGGIITYVERLAKGFLEAGHRCDLLNLCYQEKVSGGKTRSKEYQIGEAGVPVHPIYGWSFPKENKIPYKGEALQAAIERLSSYDLVIWQTPAPSMPVNKNERENVEWMELFENSAKQIIVIHDGNLLTLYPQLSKAIAGKKITATAPHPRGFNSIKHLGIDQSLIMIPQYPANQDINFFDKQKGFSICQIWKAWKHTDEVVRAISYMKPLKDSVCQLRAVSGTGLHYYYMTSPDKCKYYHLKDARPDLVGKRIWDTAVENGMDYRGVLSFEDRDKLMSESLLFLDTSWVSDDLGNHLNGAVPEAMRMGCVPVGKPLTFRQSLQDPGLLYSPGINYLEIPQDATDVEYAEYLEEFSNLSVAEYERIITVNYEILRNYFDYRFVAQQFVDQALWGIQYMKCIQVSAGTGQISDQLIKASDKVMSTYAPTLT